MDESTFICFSSYEGSTGSLVTNDCAGSQPACAAGLKPQPLSLRLQEGFCFLQRSSARHPLNAPCGVACLREAGCRVYHVLHSTPEDLGPLSTPAVLRFASGDGRLRLSRLRQADTNQHLQRKSAAFCPNTLHGWTAALRAFFTFLRWRGDIHTDLASGVPTVACLRLSTVPKFIEPAQVQRLLASCDQHTVRGQRDYTILLLLARLGLRAGEVVALRLEDLHWEVGEMLVRGKGQRLDRLPIPADVGRALARYLRQGRPRCSVRQVFVRLNAPHREFACPSDISTIVRQAMDRAGLHPPCRGAHVLRHSLATHMLQRGASLAEIGEVLRHRAPTSTEHYSKVALAALRPLAQPWPEEGL